jgi:hypothetical protein
MMIGDNLTQGTKVIDHALHPATVVADAEVALLEDAEPVVELQNTGCRGIKPRMRAMPDVWSPSVLE